jgi:hypothetical protein
VRHQQLPGVLLVLCSSHITAMDAAAAALKQRGLCMDSTRQQLTQQFPPCWLRCADHGYCSTC